MNLDVSTTENDLYISTPFGVGRDSSLIVQEDISLLLSSYMRPQNKVEI